MATEPIEPAALSATLTKMDAPAELILWSRGYGEDLAGAWEQCPSPPWLLWLAGAVGTTLDKALLVVVTWGGEVARSVPESLNLVVPTLEVAEDGAAGDATGEECAAAAARAESAARSAPASFREKPPLGFEPIAMAAAWTARAAEGLVASRQRAEAVRMQRAQHVASLLGTGVDTLLERAGPMCLAPDELPDSPVHAELLYAVAALAQAARYFVSTRAAQDPDRTRKDIAAESAHMVRALFKEL